MKEQKNKQFKSTKELVTWLMGMAIFLAMMGYLIYFGMQEEDPVIICVACIFLVTLLGILLGMIHPILLYLCEGIGLISIGWVLPILAHNLVLLLFTFVFGAIGFAMLLEVFVTLTNTKNNKFYKKYGEFLVQLLTFYTAEEGTIGGTFHKLCFKGKQIFRFLMMIYFIVFGLVIFGFGIWAFSRGEMSMGTVMVIIAVFFIWLDIDIYRKGR